MRTYAINNATASIHLRLPKRLLAEMKSLCVQEDAGGLSALVRRAVRAYIRMMQQRVAPDSQPPPPEEYGAAQYQPMPQPTVNPTTNADLEYIRHKDPWFYKHIQSFNPAAQKTLAAQRAAEHRRSEQ